MQVKNFECFPVQDKHNAKVTEVFRIRISAVDIVLRFFRFTVIAVYNVMRFSGSERGQIKCFGAFPDPERINSDDLEVFRIEIRSDQIVF